jgi:hypothetical protein
MDSHFALLGRLGGNFSELRLEIVILKSKEL